MQMHKFPFENTTVGRVLFNTDSKKYYVFDAYDIRRYEREATPEEIEIYKKNEREWIERYRESKNN